MNPTDGKGEEGEEVKQDERLEFTQWRTLVLRQNTSPPVYPLTTGSEDKSAKPTLFPLHNKTCLLWKLPSFQLPFQSTEIGFLGQTVILMVVFLLGSVARLLAMAGLLKKKKRKKSPMSALNTTEFIAMKHYHFSDSPPLFDLQIWTEKTSLVWIS